MKAFIKAFAEEGKPFGSITPGELFILPDRPESIFMKLEEKAGFLCRCNWTGQVVAIKPEDGRGFALELKEEAIEKFKDVDVVCKILPFIKGEFAAEAEMDRGEFLKLEYQKKLGGAK